MFGPAGAANLQRGLAGRPPATQSPRGEVSGKVSFPIPLPRERLRVVVALVDPETKEQRSQFARDRDNRALLRVLPAAGAQRQAPAAQSTVGTKGAEDVMGRLHEQLAHESIPALRSEEHTSELQSRPHLVCRLLLEKKKSTTQTH